jgi:hypothetical protein
MMSTPNKRDALEQLHREIDRIHTDDDTTRARLDNMKSEIQQALQQEETGDESHETLIERLNEAVADLEADHPTLTAAISAVIDILSSAGI